MCKQAICAVSSDSFLHVHGGPGCHRPCRQEVWWFGRVSANSKQASISKGKETGQQGCKTCSFRRGQSRTGKNCSCPSHREQTLQASWAKHGLQVERGFRLDKDYLRKDIGDPDQIAEQAVQLKWLFNNTDVRMRMTRMSTCSLTTCSCMHLAKASSDYACTRIYVRAGTFKPSQESLHG